MRIIRQSVVVRIVLTILLIFLILLVFEKYTYKKRSLEVDKKNVNVNLNSSGIYNLLILNKF